MGSALSKISNNSNLPSGTFKVSKTTPEKRSLDKCISAVQLIKDTKIYFENHCLDVIQTSNFPKNIYSSNNGFIHTVLDAYNNHHNLVIRPDDIWAAILTQFSFYANSMQARRLYETLVRGTTTFDIAIDQFLRTPSHEMLVNQMRSQINEKLADKDAKEWILPNFTTTTDDDFITIGVLLMATMTRYYEFKHGLRCGIPLVTLEGSLEDWENILARLEKLKEFGLKDWYDLLQPIIAQFVKAKQGKPNIKFWRKILHHHENASGPTYISGWITAFCVFDFDGTWLGTKAKYKKWLRIETSDIPTGIVEVDLNINVHNNVFDGVMVAGHVATQINEDEVTIQPTLGWAAALK